MTTIKGFANYGVLTHEKQILFTIGAAEGSVVSDEVEYIIPWDWKVAENNYGEMLLISPWGGVYLPKEVLRSKNDKPYLFGYNRNRKLFNIPLEWV